MRPAIAVCQAKRCPCLALLVSSCITEVCLKHVGANSFAKGQYIRCIFIDPNSAFANKFAPTEIAGVLLITSQATNGVGRGAVRAFRQPERH